MGGIDKGFRAILDIGWANPKAVEEKSYANPIKGKGIFSTFFFLLRRGANAAQLTCLSIHVLFVFLSPRVWMISPTIWGQWTQACMHALLCGYFKLLSCMYTCKAVNGLWSYGPGSVGTWNVARWIISIYYWTMIFCECTPNFSHGSHDSWSKLGVHMKMSLICKG